MGSCRGGGSKCNELPVTLQAIAIIKETNVADKVGILQAILIGEKKDAAAWWYIV